VVPTSIGKTSKRKIPLDVAENVVGPKKIKIAGTVDNLPVNAKRFTVAAILTDLDTGKQYLVENASMDTISTIPQIEEDE